MTATGVLGVIVAAGTSDRMGQPKQLLPIGDRPMLEVAVGAAEASRLDRVVVVDPDTEGLLFNYDRSNPHLNTVFEHAAEYKFEDTILIAGSGPKRILLAGVTPGFFPALGVRMDKGRDFSASDDPRDPSSQAFSMPVSDPA